MFKRLKKLFKKKPKLCDAVWIGSLGRYGHTHCCMFAHNHKDDHHCWCGGDISREAMENYDPADY